MHRPGHLLILGFRPVLSHAPFEIFYARSVTRDGPDLVLYQPARRFIRQVGLRIELPWSPKSIACESVYAPRNVKRLLNRLFTETSRALYRDRPKSVTRITGP